MLVGFVALRLHRRYAMSMPILPRMMMNNEKIDSLVGVSAFLKCVYCEQLLLYFDHSKCMSPHVCCCCKCS